MESSARSTERTQTLRHGVTLHLAIEFCHSSAAAKIESQPRSVAAKHPARAASSVGPKTNPSDSLRIREI